MSSKWQALDKESDDENHWHAASLPMRYTGQYTGTLKNIGSHFQTHFLQQKRCIWFIGHRSKFTFPEPMSIWIHQVIMSKQCLTHVYNVTALELSHHPTLVPVVATDACLAANTVRPSAFIRLCWLQSHPDSKVHGANMGPTWGRQVPGGPQVGPMNLVIWAGMFSSKYRCFLRHIEPEKRVYQYMGPHICVIKLSHWYFR